MKILHVFRDFLNQMSSSRRYEGPSNLHFGPLNENINLRNSITIVIFAAKC